MIATLSAALELPRPVVVAMLGLWAVLIAASALVLALRARDEARYGNSRSVRLRGGG